MPKYLDFVKRDIPGRKTSYWNIHSLVDGNYLGSIGWYVPWRRYVYSADLPAGSNLKLDSSCLKEVTTFIDAEMEKRK